VHRSGDRCVPNGRSGGRAPDPGPPGTAPAGRSLPPQRNAGARTPVQRTPQRNGRWSGSALPRIYQPPSVTYRREAPAPAARVAEDSRFRARQEPRRRLPLPRRTKHRLRDPNRAARVDAGYNARAGTAPPPVAAATTPASFGNNGAPPTAMHTTARSNTPCKGYRCRRGQPVRKPSQEQTRQGRGMEAAGAPVPHPWCAPCTPHGRWQGVPQRRKPRCHLRRHGGQPNPTQPTGQNQCSKEPVDNTVPPGIVPGPRRQRGTERWGPGWQTSTAYYY